MAAVAGCFESDLVVPFGRLYFQRSWTPRRLRSSHLALALLVLSPARSLLNSLPADERRSGSNGKGSSGSGNGSETATQNNLSALGSSLTSSARLMSTFLRMVGDRRLQLYRATSGSESRRDAARAEVVAGWFEWWNGLRHLGGEITMLNPEVHAKCKPVFHALKAWDDAVKRGSTDIGLEPMRELDKQVHTALNAMRNDLNLGPSRDLDTSAQ